MILLHLLEVTLLEVLVHVDGLELHRADLQALAAVDARRILDVAVLFLGEEQQTRGALDVHRVDVRADETHHRAAEHDLAGLLGEAADLLDHVADRGADADRGVHGLAERAAAHRERTLIARHALIARAVDGVSRLGADDVAADARRQTAGLDLTVRDGLDLQLLAALGVLDLLGHDLHAVLRGVLGVEQIDRVLLVLLDAVVGLVETGGDAGKLDALEELLRMQTHGPVVAVEVRLALGAVDDERVDLAQTAADLERGGEHGAAHADDAGVANARENGFLILQLRLGQRGQIGTWGVLIVIFDYHGRDVVPQGMGSRLDGDDLAGHGRMNRGGNRRGIVADLLAHRHIITHRHDRLAWRTDVLRHGHDHLGRRRDGDHRNIRRLHIVRMNSAMILKGHLHHLSIL